MFFFHTNVHVLLYSNRCAQPLRSCCNEIVSLVQCSLTRQSRTFVSFYKLKGLLRPSASQSQPPGSGSLFSEQRSTTATQKALL